MAVLYAVYGDESADEKAERVFAVAGLFGTQQQWDDLGVKWFERTGGVDFHATDCESGQGDFANNSHEENKKLYRDLTSLLCDTKLMGHAMAVDLMAHQKHFPNADPYYLCFSYVFVRCAELGYLSVPQGEVKFTFEIYPEKEHTSAVLYHYMRSQPEWKFHRYLDIGEVGYASKKKNIGIQAADLFARESMKHLDNYIGPVKRHVRKSMQALANTNRFSVIIANDLRLGALARNADRLGKAVEGDKELGYRAWLKKTERIDDTTARMHYLLLPKSKA